MRCGELERDVESSYRKVAYLLLTSYKDCYLLSLASVVFICSEINVFSKFLCISSVSSILTLSFHTESYLILYCITLSTPSLFSYSLFIPSSLLLSLLIFFFLYFLFFQSEAAENRIKDLELYVLCSTVCCTVLTHCSILYYVICYQDLSYLQMIFLRI
jgi:hypothetical protein